MKKRMLKFIGLAAVMTLIFTIVGCTQAQRPMPDQPGNPNINTPAPGDVNLDPNGVDNVPRDTDLNPDQNLNPDLAQRTPMTQDYRPGRPTDDNRPISEDARRKASTITSTLNAMEPIENSTAVISGNTALVGIDIVDNYYKYDEAEYLKDNLEDKVRTMMPGITNVAITDSPDMYRRIEKLSKDMDNGNTMEGLTNEFNDLVNRILPNRR